MKENVEYRLLASDKKTIFTSVYHIPCDLTKDAEEKVLFFCNAFFASARDRCGKRALEQYEHNEDRLKRIRTPSITAQVEVSTHAEGEMEEIKICYLLRRSTRVVCSFEEKLIYDRQLKVFLPK